MSLLDKLKEAREEREKVLTFQRSMLDKADEEGRELTSDETAQYEKAEADFDEKDKEVKAFEKEMEAREERRKALDEKREAITRKGGSDYHTAAKSEDKGYIDPRSTEDYSKAFRQMLLARVWQDVPEHEKRALQADLQVSGGYLVAPTQFVADLIKEVDDEVYVRRYARMWQMPRAEEIEVPERANRMSDPTWTAEIKTGGEDSTLDFAKRNLRPHPLARRIKVSNTLLRVSALSVDGIVRDEFGYEVATVLENAYLNGSGVNQPLGVFTAHDAGISTARDVSAGNGTTAIKSDNIWNCIFTLKPQYRRRARWMFHRDAVKMIRKLKTGDGDYIWQSGIAGGTPATIGGLPYDESEFAPSTFTTGLYVGLLCDWRQYWIVDALNMQISVLRELYAETNQTGYICRYEGDGQPVLEEAFVRMTLA